MEIERKYVIPSLPKGYDTWPVRLIEQGYLSTEPVVRIRRDNDEYILTYKSKGLMIREEYNLPLTAEAYAHLLKKADGRIIRKHRYMIPLAEGYRMASDSPSDISLSETGLFIELDVFDGDLAPLILAEVEFPDPETAKIFRAPSWFGEDVTYDERYQNSRLSNPDVQI
ncbi:MAG TPA: adenylate cyclase [Lachnospiraceae bacterium]|nr:adenylate cyclase [Lachnospiraceae bacterium]